MENSEKYPNLNTPNAIKNRFNGETAVEAGKKGNKKRSENIQIKKLLIDLLQDKVRSNVAKQIIKNAGMEEKKTTRNKEVLALSIMQGAFCGDYKMTQLLLKIIGEMPNDNTMYNAEAQKADLETLVNAIKGVNVEDDTEKYTSIKEDKTNEGEN